MNLALAKQFERDLQSIAFQPTLLLPPSWAPSIQWSGGRLRMSDVTYFQDKSLQSKLIETCLSKENSEWHFIGGLISKNLLNVRCTLHKCLRSSFFPTIRVAL